ncbi:MAG: hypothetical protein ACYDAG_15985, partial [Chloroflexota bacterium]
MVSSERGEKSARLPMRLAAAGTMVLTLLVSGVGLPPARAVALPAAAPATAAAAVPPPAYPA